MKGSLSPVADFVVNTHTKQITIYNNDVSEVYRILGDIAVLGDFKGYSIDIPRKSSRAYYENADFT